MSTRPDSANPSMLSYIHLCTHKYIHKTPNTHHTHMVFDSRQDIHDIHCFLYEFNFKEVICDSHKLSVKCYNNQTVYFYGQLLLSRLVLAVVKVSAFVVANQLIAHQTMNVISLPMQLYSRSHPLSWSQHQLVKVHCACCHTPHTHVAT